MESPRSTALMNYNLIGVPLPAGAKSVQLRFTTSAYEKGRPIRSWRACSSIAWLIGGVVMDRREAR